mmetsp:Transcript_899/g.2894  ORF Transcript_899/g.2894 Transcript_899/m.2894 type:complete len:160 (-) Transcript_899:389-868(-)
MTRLSKRTRQHMFAGNYALSGLVGFDMHGKTCGIIGTGLIGRCTAAILLGMGCRVLAYDPFPNQTARDMGIEYVELEELLASSRVISLHCPLTAEAREEEPSCFAPRISERSLRTGRDATPPRHRRRRGGARLAKDRCASPRQLELESRGRLARLLRER